MNKDILKLEITDKDTNYKAYHSFTIVNTEELPLMKHTYMYGEIGKDCSFGEKYSSQTIKVDGDIWFAILQVTDLFQHRNSNRSPIKPLGYFYNRQNVLTPIIYALQPENCPNANTTITHLDWSK